MTADQARDQLFSRLEQELKGETGAMILKHEQELKQNSDRLAREIIGMAVQRYAAAHCNQHGHGVAHGDEHGVGHGQWHGHPHCFA